MESTAPVLFSAVASHRGVRAGFEQRFDHMVRIFAVGAAQVQREPALSLSARKNSSVMQVSKIADALLRERSVEHKVRAAADIYGAEAERFIHRDHGMAVAHDAAAVAERLLKRTAEHDAGIFHRVVAIDIPVALGF